MNVYIGGPISQQVTNYVPQMIANTQDGYTATCSAAFTQPRGAFYVSDASTSPDYCFHSTNIGSGNRGWSQIQLPKGIIVNRIEIGARKNETPSNLRPINAFSLKGSNDGSTWTEIKSVSGLGTSWSIGSVQSWNITGQTIAYTYLKLEVQAYSSYVAFDYWNIDGVVDEIPELKNAYIGGESQQIVMTLDDINEQSEFTTSDADWSQVYMMTVTTGNPVQYSYSSSERYWGGKSIKTVTIGTAGEYYMDFIFGPGNYSGQSNILVRQAVNTTALGVRQYSISDTYWQPIIEFFGNSIVAPTSFFNNDRHTLLYKWENGIGNGWYDGTQIFTNQTLTLPTAPVYLSINGGQISWGGANNVKSIYDFYIKSN